MSPSSAPTERPGSRAQILDHLRRHRQATVVDLAGATGLAPVTLRYHLGRLREAGLVLAESVPAGRGRPHHTFRLSAQAVAALAEDRPHAQLAAALIEALRAVDPEAPARALRAAGARLAETRRESFDGRPMADRLDALVALLADEGFALGWVRDDCGYVVREFGCPYRMLAATHGEVCAMDLEVIRRVTGTPVAREAWRGDGAGGCAFRLPREPLGAGV